MSTLPQLSDKVSALEVTVSSNQNNIVDLETKITDLENATPAVRQFLEVTPDPVYDGDTVTINGGFIPVKSGRKVSIIVINNRIGSARKSVYRTEIYMDSNFEFQTSFVAEGIDFNRKESFLIIARYGGQKLMESMNYDKDKPIVRSSSSSIKASSSSSKKSTKPKKET